MHTASHQLVDNNTPLVDSSCIEFWNKMSDLMPGVIYIFNHETMSNEYSNRSIGEILGYSPEEVIQMGDNLFTVLVHPEDLGKLYAHLSDLAKLAPGAVANFEYRVMASDGSERWLRSVDSVFETASDGSMVRHVGIALDVTAQKQAEFALLEINQQLEARVKARTADLEMLNSELGTCMAQRSAELNEVNQDLKDLTYVATHDLKGPINNLSSLTHMLSDAENLLPPEHVETLAWMKDVCHQASDKLDALICVAQAHSGALEQFTDVDIDAATETALVNLHFQTSKARAIVSTDFQAHSAWFLRREMEHLLQSVIGNAIKYQQPGRRPRINIKSRKKPGHVEISVVDNGSGLDLPKDEPKVFGLFKRAHTEPEGSGVSLYAIRRTLDRVGGKINVTSELGKGSCFSICLKDRPATA